MCALHHLGANLEVCVQGWVALMRESDPRESYRPYTWKDLYPGQTAYWEFLYDIYFALFVFPALIAKINTRQNISFLMYRFTQVKEKWEYEKQQNGSELGEGWKITECKNY